MILLHRARWAALALFVAALAGLPDPGEAASGCGASYTVQSGDTLAAIAERCGTSVEALRQANPLVTDPARISIGWKLTIPGARASLGPESEVRPPARDEAAEAAVAAGSYEVQQGDSFASIATALQVPMRALLAANAGVDPFGLKPGQVLQVPAGDGSPEPKPTTDEADAAKGADAAEASAPLPPASTAADAPAAETDASEPGTSEAVQRVTLEGRVERGTECPVLETAEGETYSLVSSQYGFAPGEYVEIVGETVEMSFCGQGLATVRVTSMTPLKAPQGG
jgi:LysM repeat protein